mmetsp:Transcript_37860/g.77725  ORF Transcript_37860/g.77725 Transcript_37860/m.77725 type:complete len:108 (-) Transcript_37860:45-368(-)
MDQDLLALVLYAIQTETNDGYTARRNNSLTTGNLSLLSWSRKASQMLQGLLLSCWGMVRDVGRGEEAGVQQPPVCSAKLRFILSDWGNTFFLESLIDRFHTSLVRSL